MKGRMMRRGPPVRGQQGKVLLMYHGRHTGKFNLLHHRQLPPSQAAPPLLLPDSVAAVMCVLPQAWLYLGTRI